MSAPELPEHDELERRDFLKVVGGASGLAMASVMFGPDLMQRVEAAAEITALDPKEAAQDEAFWREIQQAFTVSRGLINLNNGAVGSSPEVVTESLVRYLWQQEDAPPYQRSILAPRLETVRGALAQLFGAEAEEIAIMRNTTEAMQTVLLGLDFKAGDEVLTTEHDYFSLVGALDRREARDGILVKRIAVPVPPGSMDELVAAFERGITDKTRLILVSHPVNFTGQFFPIKQICDLAHSKGIEVAVDGAHSFAHLDFKHEELDCDYYATSLHKWLFAPKGTGMLYVRRDKIAKVWPLLYASQRMENNVRKFEAFGTRAYGPFLAIGEAVAFHNGVGAKRKEERLRYLKHYWADRLQAMPKIQFYSSLDPDMGCAIATVGIDGVNARALRTYLMDKHQILSASVTRLGINGLRITPSLYTTLEELDKFCNIMEHIAKNGLPSS